MTQKEPVPVGRSGVVRTDKRGRSYTVEMQMAMTEDGRIVPVAVTLACPEGVDAVMVRSFAIGDVAEEARRGMAKVWAAQLERVDLTGDDKDMAATVLEAAERDDR